MRRKFDLSIAPDLVPATSSASSSSGRPRKVDVGKAVTLKILMNREAKVRKQLQEKYPKLKVPATLFYPALIVRLPLRNSYANRKMVVSKKLNPLGVRRNWPSHRRNRGKQYHIVDTHFELPRCGLQL